LKKENNNKHHENICHLLKAHGLLSTDMTPQRDETESNFGDLWGGNKIKHEFQWDPAIVVNPRKQVDSGVHTFSFFLILRNTNAATSSATIPMTVATSVLTPHAQCQKWRIFLESGRKTHSTMQPVHLL